MAEEVIIDGDVDEGDIILDDSFQPVVSEPPPPEVPKDEVMATLLERFNPNTGPARRLLYDLREMMKANTKQLGFSTEPVGMTSSTGRFACSVSRSAPRWRKTLSSTRSNRAATTSNST
jgi:hypothetical protein